MNYSMRRNIKKAAKLILETVVLFAVGFCAYTGIEIAFRGYSFRAMGIAGAVIFTIIGHLNDNRNIGLLWIALEGSAIITGFELIFGSILLESGMRMWDYSNMWGNYRGVICPLFSLLWCFISVAAALLDDFIKCKLFNARKRKYTLL